MNKISFNVLYPNGITNTKIFKKPTSPLRGFQIPRADIKNLNSYDYLEGYSGIYFLFGEKEIYIGKSSSMIDRIKTHNKSSEKDFANMFVAFTTENNILTETHIDYLEYAFINGVKNGSYYKLVNSDLRNKEPNITDFDKPILDELYDEIILYLQVMNYEIYQEFIDEKSSEIFIINGKTKPKFKDSKISGRGIFEGSCIELLEGSVGIIPKTPNVPEDNRINLYYQEQISLGNFEVVDDKYYKVVSNVKFSPSASACLLQGVVSLNGWREWKLESDVKLNLDTVYR